MDQDADMTRGEASDDIFTATFEVLVLRLTIQRVPGGKVAVSWPSDANGFAPESAVSLGSSQATTGWTSVSNSPALVGDRKIVTLDAVVGQQFFRLCK